MHKLLLNIDLTAYYNKFTKKAGAEKEITSEGRSELNELLHHVNKYPKGFVVHIERAVKVKLLAYFLLKHNKGESDTFTKPTLDKMKVDYQASIQHTLEKKNEVEHNLRMKISALTSRIGSIRENRKRCQVDILYGILAARFIRGFQAVYEIKKEVPNSKAKGAKPMAKGAPPELLKYILFIADPPKIMTAKSLASKMFTGGKSPAKSSTASLPPTSLKELLYLSIF